LLLILIMLIVHVKVKRKQLFFIHFENNWLNLIISKDFSCLAISKRLGALFVHSQFHWLCRNLLSSKFGNSVSN
jgi:hypothetical protein